MRKRHNPKTEPRKGYSCLITLAESELPWFLWSGEAASMKDAEARTMKAARTAWSVMTALPDPTDRQDVTARVSMGSNRARKTHASWIAMRAMRDAIGDHLRPALARDRAIAIALAVMEGHKDDPLGKVAEIRMPWYASGADRHDLVASAGLGLKPPRHALEALAAIGLAAALAPLAATYPEEITVARPKLDSATLRAAHAAPGRRLGDLAWLDAFLRSHRGEWIADEFVKEGPLKA